MINALIAACAMAPTGLPPLQVQGTNLVDPAGKPVILKGCDVGNWLMIEFWMLALSGKPGTPPDQASLVDLLRRRFGAADEQRLMDLYRSSWMTERDWKNIQSFGFNLVRLPFDYRLLEDDEHPKQLRRDAWKWIDKAVDEAERRNLYTVLDLHGVQGGQSFEGHTGRSGQNKLWSSPEDQDRMVWLWSQIAKRYRGRSSVVAFDVMNEPYGGKKDQIAPIFQRCYDAIRQVNSNTLVFAPGYYDGFDFYKSPQELGWKNVGITMHYYPGLFGDPATVKSTLRHLSSIDAIEQKVRDRNVPFYVGEMNVVMKQTGGAPMMRRFFDAYAKNGWLTTMWSYKVITDFGGTGGGSWGMFTNAEHAKIVDLSTATEPEVEAYFRSFATQSLTPYQELRDFLTVANPVFPPLPADQTPRTVAPRDDALAGWTAADIGGARKGGLVDNGAKGFELYGGGDDIWGRTDSFRFLNRQVEGDFDLEVTLDSIENTQVYTKAGLMVRGSLKPNSPVALLSVFPGGGAQISIRDAIGAEIVGQDAPTVRVPGGKIGISRKGGTIIFSVAGREVARRDLPSLSGAVYVGPIALSHSSGELTKIAYEGLKLSP